MFGFPRNIAVSPETVQRLAELLGKESEHQPEWAKIAAEMLRGNPNMGSGYGWFGPAQTRLDFEWLINNYDRNRDGRLVRGELPPPFGKLAKAVGQRFPQLGLVASRGFGPGL